MGFYEEKRRLMGLFFIFFFTHKHSISQPLSVSPPLCGILHNSFHSGKESLFSCLSFSSVCFVCFLSLSDFQFLTLVSLFI